MKVIPIKFIHEVIVYTPTNSRAHIGVHIVAGRGLLFAETQRTRAVDNAAGLRRPERSQVCVQIIASEGSLLGGKP